jgi:quercetin dioxygenase-like cupin family protein
VPIALLYRNQSKSAFPLMCNSNDPQIIVNTPKETEMKILSLASVIAGSFTLSTAAFAGACPADQQKTDVRAAVNTPAKGVTDTVLAAIDLAREPIAARDRQLRFRKLTIEAGGIVPWHSHTDRPAIIFVQQGEIFEYASNCAVPILHKEGEVRPEVQGTSHWWENKGTKTVILYVGDILHDKDDHNM